MKFFNPGHGPSRGYSESNELNAYDLKYATSVQSLFSNLDFANDSMVVAILPPPVASAIEQGIDRFSGSKAVRISEESGRKSLLNWLGKQTLTGALTIVRGVRQSLQGLL